MYVDLLVYFLPGAANINIKQRVPELHHFSMYPGTAEKRRKIYPRGSGCGIVETCRICAALKRVRPVIADADRPEPEPMATVQLKDVKKVYPFISGEDKKKKKKSKDEPEKKKANLQITDEGVVAVQQFSLDIADKEFIVLVGPSGCGKSTTLS